MNWIIDNKEWLFSGVGVTISVIIIGYFLKRKTPHQSQEIGNKSTGYQSGRDINIGKDN